MARFFLDIHNGNGFTQDPEGQEFANIEKAVAAAREGARSLMAADLASGHLDLSGRIEICDGNRVPLASVSFAEVLELATGQALAFAEQRAGG